MIPVPSWAPGWVPSWVPELVVLWVLVGGAAGAWWYWREDTDEAPPEPAPVPGESLDEHLTDDEDDPQIVELESPLKPPEGLLGKFGGLLYTAWRQRKQEAALRKKGYVRWYLVGAGWPRPKYVKPKLKNGGVREVEYKGDWYLFPDDALVPGEQTGLWTCIHRVGDAKPIDPRDPDHEPLDADTLADYATRRPAASKPSWWSKFDLGDISFVEASIGLTIIIAVVWQVI